MGLFGPPKITLMLEKYNFTPGETAKGTVSINLKKPAYARKLKVSLIGVRKVRRGNKWQWQKVYDFDMPIAGEKDYQKEQIPFELKIPPDILDPRTSQQVIQDSLEDKLGVAGTLLSSVAVGTRKTEWKIKAQLDIPKKLDVKASQDIQLYEQ
ncbi:hypothetical protein AYK20_04735 [Thermoplasmatales archaeon SG8-52-1]|nr:MAG: hypothetical protein AYK20_04735 [Thermoplasmatales archaeon SG8-52-1]